MVVDMRTSYSGFSVACWVHKRAPRISDQAPVADLWLTCTLPVRTGMTSAAACASINFGR